jgi:Domain of unknown function(DUF2779)
VQVLLEIELGRDIHVLAAMAPQDLASAIIKALERINAQMYDLQDIFCKQHYVHPDFRGKTSIKKVSGANGGRSTRRPQHQRGRRRSSAAKLSPTIVRLDDTLSQTDKPAALCDGQRIALSPPSELRATLGLTA